MLTRRTFILGLTTAGAMATIAGPSFAQSAKLEQATAVTRVYGDGLRFVAVALTYSEAIPASALSADQFKVDGRTVTDVYPATSSNPADRADTGSVVIVELSPYDADAILAVKIEREDKDEDADKAKGKGGPGKAGDAALSDNSWAEPSATLKQSALTLAGGSTIAAAEIATSKVNNLILDDFQQLEWHDPQIGDVLPYNLFVPKDYDPSKSYPLVNFMHDAGATSADVLTTLKQGLGAISWASPEDQAKRPCFVLAPQFAEIVADDDSNTSSMLDTTINLIKALTEQYSIDTSKLYTTGQSGGGMLSIAMNIKYPDFFAASFLVACQWDASLVAPMMNNRLFILVSQDDSKAFPGQNAITEALEAEGAKVARAEWDGGWNADQFRFAFDDLNAEGAKINYVTFAEGTVFEEGADRAGASGHRNTWRLAYSIEPIREWLLRDPA
ncbi:prolyl oligopeptidase family serine peptidase [uncultured Cohaesibacter sp.]|uniref:prolyl oligopeptidase family serine peptidase n=1 Tax=uncultured Cohaesibacter sp. TaxID=1002546 RepID=UPI0029C61914|nr:prolyl oligopeptidase family serine peptidase [uncultured Cohaesibacter sp.]